MPTIGTLSGAVTIPRKSLSVIERPKNRRKALTSHQATTPLAKVLR